MNDHDREINASSSLDDDLSAMLETAADDLQAALDRTTDAATGYQQIVSDTVQVRHSS